MSAIVEAPRYRWMRQYAADYASFNVLTDVPNLKAWYCADTVTSSGGFVSQVTDKASVGPYHFVQATGSKQSAIVLAGSDPNGFPCIVSDGGDDAFTLASPGYGAMNGITIYNVLRSLVTPGTSGFLASIGNLADAQSVQEIATTTQFVSRFVNPSSTSSSWNYDSGVNQFNSSAIRITSAAGTTTNGGSTVWNSRSRLGQPGVVSTVASTGATIASQAASLFGTKAGTGSYLGVGLYERIVCSEAHSADQMRRVELYLAGKYGLL